MTACGCMVTGSRTGSQAEDIVGGNWALGQCLEPLLGRGETGRLAGRQGPQQLLWMRLRHSVWVITTMMKLQRRQNQLQSHAKVLCYSFINMFDLVWKDQVCGVIGVAF